MTQDMKNRFKVSLTPCFEMNDYEMTSALKSLDAALKVKWLLTENVLPKKDIPCLCADRHGRLSICRFKNISKSEQYFIGEDKKRKQGVVAWLPLPAQVPRKRKCKKCGCTFISQQEQDVCDYCEKMEEVERKAVVERGKQVLKGCVTCQRYPCMKGMDKLSSNLALTCRSYEKKGGQR